MFYFMILTYSRNCEIFKEYIEKAKICIYKKKLISIVFGFTYGCKYRIIINMPENNSTLYSRKIRNECQ